MNQKPPTVRRAPRAARRALLVGAVVLVCSAAVGASAADLGGLAADDIGAGATRGYGHPSGFDIHWVPSWDGTQWIISTMTVGSAEPFRAGERVRLALTDIAGAARCTLTVAVAADAPTVTIGPDALAASCAPVPFDVVSRVAVAVGS